MATTKLQNCPHHGITIFVSRGDNRYRCRKCAVIAVSKRRKKLKILAIAHKGGQCLICQYSNSIEGLSFHHLDPSLKEIDLSSGRTKSWGRIKAEIDKCILVCLTCHAEIHAGMHPNNLIKNI